MTNSTSSTSGVPRDAKRLRAAAGLAAGLALAAGCAAPRTGVEVAPAPAPAGGDVHEMHRAAADVRAALQHRQANVVRLRGRGTLTVQSPDWEGASRVQAVVVARRPEDLRVRGYTPISTAFDCLTGPGQFVLHLPTEGEVWTGPAEELRAVTGLPLVPADLVDALFGIPFEVADSLRVLRADRDRVTAAWRLPDGSEVEAEFRRHPTLPERFVIRRDGKVRAELEYGDYLREPDGWWPRKYFLSWPEEGASFHLTLVAVELNPDLETGSFEFVAPEEAQWFRVRSSGQPSGRAARGAAPAAGTR